MGAAALIAGCAHTDQPPHPKATPMHQTTEWRLEPSLKYDALCFANILTGDPFYLEYYQGEYDRFQPKITPEAHLGLDPAPWN